MTESSKRTRSLRKLGCENIDFVGRTERNKSIDKKLAKTIITDVADPQHIPKDWDGKVQTYCKQRQWLTDKYKNKYTCDLDSIPLLDLAKSGKQYVLGRMSNLKDYYACPDMFYTLDSDDWDSLYQVNDLFIYCAQGSTENDFPIRIVTSKNKGIKSTDIKTGIAQYNKVLTLPHLLNQKSKIHITSRELCQISKYFGMYIYQSMEFNNIFFASKKSPSMLSTKMKKYKLRLITLE